MPNPNLLLVFTSCLILLSESAIHASPKDGEVARALFEVKHQGNNLLSDNSWQPFESGFEQKSGFVACDNLDNETKSSGMTQSVLLDQKQAGLIVASLESKAENAGGSSDSDYAVYLDIYFVDGTQLWGQSAAFDTGSHDWQERKLFINPPKPIKSISFYALFRNHSGKVWFRNPKLTSQPVPKGLYRLDNENYVLQDKAVEGFQIRDVTKGGSYVHLEKEAIGIQMEVTETTSGQTGESYFDITLHDRSGRDRAITLAYSLPVQGEEISWLHNPRIRKRVEANREYSNTRPFPGVGNERLSLYPLAAIAYQDRGVGLGIDMKYPAFYRLIYHSATKEFLLLFDLGFTPENPTVKLRFCRFSFDPEWGFRAAIDQYYQLFPNAFVRRVTRQGNWMPFAKISEVEGWKDFGFAFKEGHNETEWDDENGITTFHYTEPMTWWMKMPPEMPRTHKAALDLAKSLAEKGSRPARALFSSGFHDEQNKLTGIMSDTPWTNGIVWSMNSMPGVSGDVTDFSVKWNPEVKQNLYGPESKGLLDGEYFDSVEGYVTAKLDFRRDNFSAARTPLCFSSTTKRPGIFRNMIAYEYMRAIADEMHAENRLTMGNSTPIRICWFAPLLDVMGSETNWKPDKQWQPMSDADLLYRRAMSKGKPYCFLQNTDFRNFPHHLTEKYMQRCLAYGFFPGFFSHNASEGHYFKTPELYQRDRGLFKKYLPLCRSVAEAGWQPVTHAHCDNEHVYLERFGDKFLTVFNDSQQEQKVTLRLGKKFQGGKKDLVSGESVIWKSGQTNLTLPAEGVAVIRLFPGE